MGLDWRCEIVCGGKRNSGVNIKKRIESCWLYGSGSGGKIACRVY